MSTLVVAPEARLGLPARRRLVGRIVVGLIALPGAAAVLLALAGPLLAPHDPARTVGRPLLSPGPGLLLGTDHLGRDVWSRLLHGGATVVVLPVLATAVATALGAGLGLLAGYRGGRTSAVIEKLAEFVLVIPAVLVLLVLVNGWGAAGWVLGLVVVLFGVPATTRYTRAVALTVVRAGYVEAAVALGERTGAVLRRELLPAVTGPVLADAGLRLVGAIYIVATAGFLGFGDGSPDWATMIAENISAASLNPWSVVAPGLCIAALAISVNLVVDRLAARVRR